MPFPVANPLPPSLVGTSYLLWRGLALTPPGLRVSRPVECLGQDAAELKIETCPGFVLMPETDDTD